MMILTCDGELYTMGSNQFGQLGVSNSKLLSYYQHQIDLSMIYYSDAPVKVPYFSTQDMGYLDLSKQSSDTQPVEISAILQIAAGDFFNLVLTQSGKVFVWGLMDDSRLGLRKVS